MHSKGMYPNKLKYIVWLDSSFMSLRVRAHIMKLIGYRGDKLKNFDKSYRSRRSLVRFALQCYTLKRCFVFFSNCKCVQLAVSN